MRALLHPGSGRGKLPNGISHPYVNVEPTQDNQGIVKDAEASGQNVLVARRPGSSNNADAVSNRVIAEDATARGLAGEIGTTCAVNVRCPRLSEHAATHVVRKPVGVTG